MKNGVLLALLNGTHIDGVKGRGFRHLILAQANTTCPACRPERLAAPAFYILAPCVTVAVLSCR